MRLRERLKQEKSGEKKKESSSGIKTPVSPTEPKFPIPDSVKLSEKEKEIAVKVTKLIKLRIPVNKETPTGKVSIDF